MALYVRSSIQSSVWTYSADNRTYELHWVRVGSTFIPALYHPPVDLLDYIETCVEELIRDFPAAPNVIVGDLNQLPDQDVVERTGLTQIVHQLTRGVNTSHFSVKPVIYTFTFYRPCSLLSVHLGPQLQL